jgi:hypothetical protein
MWCWGANPVAPDRPLELIFAFRAGRLTAWGLPATAKDADLSRL